MRRPPTNVSGARTPKPAQPRSSLGAAAELASRQLEADERGLVVSAPITIGESGGSVGSALDPQELRFSLLFWDLLDYPTNNVITVGLDPDAAFLVESGILARSHAKVTGAGEFGLAFLEGHLQTYRALEKRDPGRWSLARGERSLSFREGETVVGRGAILELHQAIPVPNKDVPLAEVMEFKARRRAELLGLRHHLERLYQSIIDAPDRDLALATEVSDLEKAIADHIRVSKEAKFPLRLSGFQAKLDWKTVSAGTGAFLAASQQGLSLVGSLLSGAGAAAAISLSVGVGLRDRKASKTPFEYVSKFHKELF